MMNRVMTVAMPALKRVSECPFTRCVGSLGTIVNLAEIAQRMYHPAESLKKPVLLLANLERLYGYLCSLVLEERRKVPDSNPERAYIILAGASILLVIMRTLKISVIEISDRWLREGIMMNHLDEISGMLQSKQMQVKEESVL